MQINQGLSDTLTVGGRTFTDLENLVILSASGAATKYTTFKDQDGDDYQVPTGFKLKIEAVQSQTSNVSSAVLFSIGYGDDGGLVNSASGPTNFAYVGGNILYANYTVGSGLDGTRTYIGKSNIPADKYPTVLFGAGGTDDLMIFGRLEAV